MEISDELRKFLVEEARVAKVASIRKAGTPWVSPVWFSLDGNQPIFVINARSILGRTLFRDPHLAFCVDEVQLPYRFAVIEGRVEISRDALDARRWAKDMVVRYQPEVDDVEGHLDELLSGNALVCRTTIARAHYEETVD